MKKLYVIYIIIFRWLVVQVTAKSFFTHDIHNSFNETVSISALQGGVVY